METVEPANSHSSDEILFVPDPGVASENGNTDFANQNGESTTEPQNPYAELARTAIDGFSVRGGAENISIAGIAGRALGTNRLPRPEFRKFIDSVNADPRIKYLGDGRYQILNSPESPMPNTPTSNSVPNQHSGNHSPRTMSEGSTRKPGEFVRRADSVDDMVRLWRHTMYRERKPFNRRRNHYKTHTDMASYPEET